MVDMRRRQAPCYTLDISPFNKLKTMKLFESTRIEKLVAVLLLAASLLLGLQAIGTIRDLFEPRPAHQSNVITVSGEGTVLAIPDIARITFTVAEEGDTVAQAQEKATQKSNTALALVEELGIEERDIKTTSYNVSPKYNQAQPCFGGVCPEYERRVIGYRTSQTVAIKVRDTEMAGEVLSVLGGAGVSNLSGPSFTVDDPDALLAEAREMAIDDAREKAKELASDLRVRLVRVTGFWENSGGSPAYYAMEERAFMAGDDGKGGAVPSLPVGEDEIQVNVSITYEIR